MKTYKIFLNHPCLKFEKSTILSSHKFMVDTLENVKSFVAIDRTQVSETECLVIHDTDSGPSEKR